MLCSADGLDELSWAAPTYFVRVANGSIQEEGEFSPEDFAFVKHPRDLLQISSPKEAKERSLQFLAGKGSSGRKSCCGHECGFTLRHGERRKSEDSGASLFESH